MPRLCWCREKVLGKLEESDGEKQFVLQTVSKTGKKTAYWEAEAPTKPEAKPAEAVAAA
ncbi:unnamed protein product [Prunus armeniaca]|uniref:Uncharacterized protein n=1 Tax=Prunus armeniaca TaxID=36596 RepID=A0A6J5TVH6_PRUAR|nr:unnamed protein product [Prunus armeniaca]